MAVKDYSGNTPGSTSYATTSNPGLMSATDKTKLDNLNSLAVDTLPIGSEVLYESNDSNIPDGWELVPSDAYYNPNMLINGDFQVWQRGDTVTVSTRTSTARYICDRWRTVNSITSGPADIEFSRLNDTTGIKSNVNPWKIEQILEHPLDEGDKYTISYSIKGVIGTPVTITGGTEYTMTTSPHISYRTVLGYPVISIDCTGDGIDWIKLEQGETATKFIHRSYEEELRDCHAYYWQPKKTTGSSSNDDVCIGVGSINKTRTGFWGVINNPVPFVRFPTLHFDCDQSSSAYNTNAYLYIMRSAEPVRLTTITLQGSCNDVLNFSGSCANTNTVAGDPVWMYLHNDGGIYFDAENYEIG